MDLLGIVLLVVFGFSAVLLILIILLQDEQGEGLGGIFGGGSSNQIGNRKGNILTKTTTVLGAMFLIIAFCMAWINKSHNTEVGILDKETGKSTSSSYEWWNKDTKVEVVNPDASASPESSALPVTGLENPAASAAASTAAPATAAPSPSPGKKN